MSKGERESERVVWLNERVYHRVEELEARITRDQQVGRVRWKRVEDVVLNRDAMTGRNWEDFMLAVRVEECPFE